MEILEKALKHKLHVIESIKSINETTEYSHKRESKIPGLNNFKNQKSFRNKNIIDIDKFCPDCNESSFGSDSDSNKDGQDRVKNEKSDLRQSIVIDKNTLLNQ